MIISYHNDYDYVDSDGNSTDDYNCINNDYNCNDGNHHHCNHYYYISSLS